MMGRLIKGVCNLNKILHLYLNIIRNARYTLRYPLNNVDAHQKAQILSTKSHNRTDYNLLINWEWGRKW